MTSTDIQSLLRFLTGPAKLPLRDAMGRVKLLLEDGLSSPEIIAKTPVDKLQKVFTEEKIAKQVLSAAKRSTNFSSSKKRSASRQVDASSSNNATDSTPISPSKRRKTNATPSIDASNPQTWEIGLDLPSPARDEGLISITTLTTNRAPLLLAFALISLAYTYPWLPASSRFSLAQGLLELTASSKAKSLGIIRPGDGGKEETVEEGYKKLRVLTKELPVLRRWDVQNAPTPPSETKTSPKKQGQSPSHEDDKPPTDDVKPGQPTSINPGSSASAAGELPSPSTTTTATTQGTASSSDTNPTNEPIYWSLSPQLLSQPPTATKLNPSALPIFLPHAAHSYLTRSFSQEALPLLLGALHLVYESWVNELSPAELDRRSWAWYCRIRPTVADGPEGWGGKGVVKLKDILGLRRQKAG